MHDRDSAQLPRTPPATQIHSQQLPQSVTSQQDQPMSSPRTPQPQITSTPSVLEPPEPPKVRIKRRRPALASTSIPQDDGSSAGMSPGVPSIELSGPASHENVSQDFLAPSSASMPRVGSPPRTPLAKLQTTFNSLPEGLKTPEPWSAQSLWSKGESITRPSSTWSEISDSSASSLSSLDTFATHGESCTSPESEVTDPFTFPDYKENLMPSALPKDLRSLGKRVKKQYQGYWTSEMDEHLWLTYMTYLSDPTVTPFKTLPGMAPPLGVCHRVARRAKRHWKGSRTLLGTLSENETFASLDGTLMHRQSSVPPPGSPETLKPHALPRSFSAGARRNPGRWPHSNSGTRKRLRELCKRKPALSPHYQRLMHTRSPSPFESSSPQGHSLSSPKTSSDQSFSTRDLNVTLSTSTASSMQPGNLLSQLASSSPKTPQRINPHLKSQSLQSTFGFANDHLHREGLASLRRLASPFQEQPRRDVPSSFSGESTLRPHHMPPPQQRKHYSPIEIQHPKPLSASMKRRAQYQLGEELVSDDPELRRSFLEDVFRDPAVASGKRRVRSRGFSLGAVRNAAEASSQPSRQLSELFTPPATENSQQASSNTQQDRSPVPGNLGDAFKPPSQSQLTSAPSFANGAVRRLGSPFVPTSNVGMSNTFPRSLFPQGLDSISNLDSQRQPQVQPKPDVEMEDPFSDNNTGTMRRYHRSQDL